MKKTMSCHRFLRLKMEIAAFDLQKALRQIVFAFKYDPSQPRVPAGDPAGGQWTSGGNGTVDPESVPSGESMSPEEIIAYGSSLDFVAGGRSYQVCLSLCYPLLERFSPRGTTNINQWDFIRCMNACLGK